MTTKFPLYPYLELRARRRSRICTYVVCFYAAGSASLFRFHKYRKLLLFSPPLSCPALILLEIMFAPIYTCIPTVYRSSEVESGVCSQPTSQSKSSLSLALVPLSCLKNPVIPRKWKSALDHFPNISRYANAQAEDQILKLFFRKVF